MTFICDFLKYWYFIIPIVFLGSIAFWTYWEDVCDRRRIEYHRKQRATIRTHNFSERYVTKWVI